MYDVISLKVKNHFEVQVRDMILPFAEDPQNSWCWEQYSLRDNHHLLEVFLLLLSAYSLYSLLASTVYTLSCCLLPAA